MDKQFDDEKKGFLRHEADAQVMRKGSFQIDGKKYYGAIISSVNDKGDTKYEFVQSLGLLHLNDDKKSERSPDMGGKITHNGKQFKLGVWAKESEKGFPYSSLGFDPIEESYESQEPVDKAPF